MPTIDALECSIIHGVSKSTWTNWGRADPRRPKPIAQDGRVFLWDKDEVIEYLDIREGERTINASDKAKPTKGKHPPERFPRAGPKTRKKQFIPDVPRAYVTSDLSSQLFEVHRLIDGRHELFEIDVGGNAKTTGVHFSSDEDEMIEQLSRWVDDNMPGDREITAYEHTIIKGSDEHGSIKKRHASRGRVGMRARAKHVG